MLYKLKDILIKSRSKEEKDYCKKYNINLQKLDNGITIVGMSCRKDATFFANIKWFFSEGSYNNVPGSVHFLEHFINRKIRPTAQRNSCNLVATTTRLEVIEELSGVSNPKVNDYGIWAVLKGIREGLESPLRNSSDLEKDIEIERKIIKAEIQRNETDHNYQVGTHSRKVVYSPKNPQAAQFVTGTPEDLEKLTADILKSIEKNVLIPANLLIGIYTEGDISITKKAIEELKNLFSDFPRSEKPKKDLDRKLLEEINPDFKPSKHFSYNTNLKNGIVTTQFVWIFRERFPSVNYFALQILRDILSTELFAYSRKMGWGYYTDVSTIVQNDNTEILTLRIDQKTEGKKNIEDEIKKIITAAKDLTENAVNLEKIRQSATPITVSDRFSWVVDGLIKYDSIMDIDKIRGNKSKVKPVDLNNLINKLLLTKPAVIVTGDLD